MKKANISRAKAQFLINIIPFGIAITMVLASAIQVWTMPESINEQGEIFRYTINANIKYAAIGLALTLALILFKKSYWKYLFLVLIIFSFTPFIKFYHKSFSVFLGLLSIDLTAIALLISHLVANDDLRKNILGLLQMSEKEVVEENEHRVAFFENKFKSKSQKELDRIVQENSLVPEAVEAAKRLLQKREST